MSISSTLQAAAKAPAEELILSLEDLSATTQLFARASRLRPRLNAMLRWETLQAEERRLVSEFIEYRDANEKIVSLSLIVVCYGLLEKFVRELLERAVAVINSELKIFDRLPKSLTNENIFRTGVALQSIRGTRSHLKFEYSLLARNLGTCAIGADSYVLNAQCFSFGHGILTPTSIDHLFQRIGVELDWDRFGANSKLKALLGEPRTRDCTKATRNFLEDLVTKRNVVAHSGGLEIVITDNEFERVKNILPIFCTILVEQVATQLQSKYG